MYNYYFRNAYHPTRDSIINYILSALIIMFIEPCLGHQNLIW
jgi:hypothetical protein